MESVSHREMRNRSGEILRRVEAGESVQVTNNGRLAAVIVPPSRHPLDSMIARGEARAPVLDRSVLLQIPPVSSSVSSAELVDDARGQW